MSLQTAPLASRRETRSTRTQLRPSRGSGPLMASYGLPQLPRVGAVVPSQHLKEVGLARSLLSTRPEPDGPVPEGPGSEGAERSRFRTPGAAGAAVSTAGDSSVTNERIFATTGSATPVTIRTPPVAASTTRTITVTSRGSRRRLRRGVTADAGVGPYFVGGCGGGVCGMIDVGWPAWWVAIPSAGGWHAGQLAAAAGRRVPQRVQNGWRGPPAVGAGAAGSQIWQGACWDVRRVPQRVQKADPPVTGIPGSLFTSHPHVLVTTSEEVPSGDRTATWARA